MNSKHIVQWIENANRKYKISGLITYKQADIVYEKKSIPKHDAPPMPSYIMTAYSETCLLKDAQIQNLQWLEEALVSTGSREIPNYVYQHNPCTTKVKILFRAWGLTIQNMA